MGVTTNYSWPYPVSSDAPNGPAQMQSLGQAADTTVKAVQDRCRGIVLQADESRISTTTLSDSALTLTVLANKDYAFKLYVPYQAIDTADMKYDITFPAGASMRHTPFGPGTSQVTDVIPPAASRAGISVADGSGVSMAGNSNSASATVLVVEGSLRVGGTAGSITFRFAQVASIATNTTIKQGSYLMVWQLT